jgi:DNA-binding transcriptional regulator YdaS (Cro superfamily)
MTARTPEDRARSARLCEEASRAGFGPHTSRAARRTEVLRLKRLGCVYVDIAELFGISEQAVQQAGTTTRRLSPAEWQLVQAVREGNVGEATAMAGDLASAVFREKIR